MQAGRVKRLAIAACAAAGAWLLAGPAGASGDYACGPRWTLDSPDLDCGSSLVMSPGVDTRVNLALLLRDRGGLASAAGTYPTLEWDRSFGHNFVDWSIFQNAAYPFEPRPENDYYGSRCISLKGGDAVFRAAVVANGKLKPDERERLLAAREQLAPICQTFGGGYYLAEGDEARNTATPAWPVDVASKTGKDYVAYLVAAAAFYGGDWGAARSGFAALAGSSDAWIRETARYMLPRVELNAAQALGFDEWGSFDLGKADRAAAAAAGQGFADYLKAYPKGAYAASARGLQRRVLWLADDLAGLAAAYEAMLGATTPGSAAEAELIEEVDNKLLTVSGAEKAIDTPLLLATYDLMRMRGSGGGADGESGYRYGPEPIDESELAQQEPVFKGRDELYQFLRANYSFYVAGNAQDVLLRIPDNSVTTGHSALDFSRQVLRGQALAALKDPGEEAFWIRLVGGSTGLYQRPAAELGLALHWEKNGKLARVFAAGSPIEDSMIRRILLKYSAGPEILRAEARNAARPQVERDLALFTLLEKQLSRGLYAGFVGDVKLVPAGADTEAGLWDITSQETVPVGLFTRGKFTDAYPCPALGVTAAALARNAKDVKGRLCLGEFWRLNGFDDFNGDRAEQAEGALGTSAGQFAGKAVSRGELYDAIIADTAAPRAERAYALYRAIRCYAPSGYNSCGNDEVDESRRKAWFNTLKRQYAETQWAKELKYYW